MKFLNDKKKRVYILLPNIFVLLFNHSMLFKTLVSILYTLMHEEFKVTICYMLFNVQHYRYVCTIITFNIFGRFHLIFAQTCAPALIFLCRITMTKLLFTIFILISSSMMTNIKKKKNIRCVDQYIHCDCEAITDVNFYKFLLFQVNYTFPATIMLVK